MNISLKESIRTPFRTVEGSAAMKGKSLTRGLERQHGA